MQKNIRKRQDIIKKSGRFRHKVSHYIEEISYNAFVGYACINFLF